MKASIICCAFMGAVLLSTIDLSASECCYVPLKCSENSKSVNRCYDCTEATLYCGKGKCNVVGCNCDDGCRQGDSSLWCWNLASGCKGKFFYEKTEPLSVDNGSASDLLSAIDTDSDGKLSFSEAKAYITEHRPTDLDIDEELLKLDTNGDGFLQFNEVDGY